MFIFISCCFGSFLVFLAVSEIVTVISLNLTYTTNIRHGIRDINDDFYDYYC